MERTFATSCMPFLMSSMTNSEVLFSDSSVLDGSVGMGVLPADVCLLMLCGREDFETVGTSVGRECTVGQDARSFEKVRPQCKT